MRAHLWKSQQKWTRDGEFEGCLTAMVSHLKLQHVCGIMVSEKRPVIVLRLEEQESAELTELPWKKRMETPLCSSCLAYLNRNTIHFPPAVHHRASWTL